MCVCVCVQTVYLAEFMESNLRERDHTSEKKMFQGFLVPFFSLVNLWDCLKVCAYM